MRSVYGIHAPTHCFGGPLGAPKLSKIESKVARYERKVGAGQRCGFPATRNKCVKKLDKWQQKLEVAQEQQLAIQSVLSSTSPEATAAAINAAAAENIAAAQAGGNTTTYAIIGVSVLGVLGLGLALFAGSGR